MSQAGPTFKFAGRRYVLIDLGAPAEDAQCHLTRAERCVLEALLAGLKARDIASRRSTSLRTIHCQVANVYRKLGVACRSELLRRVRSSR